MINESRLDIYNYVCGLIPATLTKNVYAFEQPQELTDSDTKNGFIVVRIDDCNDESEFKGYTYGWVRVYIEAYVPTQSRGRLDKAKYKSFEDGITNAINAEMATPTSSTYTIDEQGFLSMDATEDTNANNLYHMFIKSFIVTIN